MFEYFRNRLAMSRDVVKLSCLRYRDYDGYFASMHQSGNHWLRQLFGTVIAIEYGLPRPEYLADKQIIGEPKCPTTIPGIPRLVFSHKICSSLVHAVPSRAMVRFPRYVIMVRDLRTMLVSHYERFKDRYQLPFSAFLRGDVNGRQFDCDIWDSIRFLNAWGQVCRRLPGQTMVLRYEDVRSDVVGEAMRVWRFLQLPPVERSVFEQAAHESSKDRMQAMSKPTRKHGVVVRADGGDPLAHYAASDRIWLMDTCDRYLNHTFGYDYAWFEGVTLPARNAA